MKGFAVYGSWGKSNLEIPESRSIDIRLGSLAGQSMQMRNFSDRHIDF